MPINRINIDFIDLVDSTCVTRTANTPDSISVQKQISANGCVIKKFIPIKLFLFPTECSPSDLELVLPWTFLCDYCGTFLLLSLSLFISLRLLLLFSFPCLPRFFCRATLGKFSGLLDEMLPIEGQADFPRDKLKKVSEFDTSLVGTVVLSFIEQIEPLIQINYSADSLGVLISSDQRELKTKFSRN